MSSNFAAVHLLLGSVRLDFISNAFGFHGSCGKQKDLFSVNPLHEKSSWKRDGLVSTQTFVLREVVLNRLSYLSFLGCILQEQWSVATKKSAKCFQKNSPKLEFSFPTPFWEDKTVPSRCLSEHELIEVLIFCETWVGD